MTQLGADPDDLRGLARSLRSAAGRLDALSVELTRRTRTSGWQGPDAAAFDHRWRAQHQPALRATADGLGGMARRLDQQALEQLRASAGAGAGPITDPGGTGPTGAAAWLPTLPRIEDRYLGNLELARGPGRRGSGRRARGAAPGWVASPCRAHRDDRRRWCAQRRLLGGPGHRRTPRCGRHGDRRLRRGPTQGGRGAAAELGGRRGSGRRPGCPDRSGTRRAGHHRSTGTARGGSGRRGHPGRVDHRPRPGVGRGRLGVHLGPIADGPRGARRGGARGRRRRGGRPRRGAGRRTWPGCRLGACRHRAPRCRQLDGARAPGLGHCGTDQHAAATSGGGAAAGCASRRGGAPGAAAGERHGRPHPCHGPRQLDERHRGARRAGAHRPGWSGCRCDGAFPL